jgi:hypothetical protein
MPSAAKAVLDARHNATTAAARVRPVFKAIPRPLFAWLSRSSAGHGYTMAMGLATARAGLRGIVPPFILRE